MARRPANPAPDPAPADDDAWHYASADDPCPVCGHDEQRCRASDDGALALCCRVESDRLTASGYGWLHVIGTPDPAKRRARPPLALLDPDTAAWRDRGYRAVLGGLSLTAAHRAGLRARGLTDDDIDRAGYRTAAQLVLDQPDDLAGAAVPAVPGLWQRKRGHRRYDVALGPFAPETIVPAAGFYVPVRDPAGRIVHHVLARDDRDPKYQWPARAGVHVHVPAHDGLTREVRVTEGQLKADVATALQPDVLTIGLPGLAWRWGRPAIEALEGTRTVLVALDQDDAGSRTTPDLAADLQAAGYHVELEEWPDHKGIDDALAAGVTPTRRPTTKPKRTLPPNRKALTWRQAIR